MASATALLHTTTHVAVGNLTAAATLALAFFAAMFADFQAVAELGWIAGCGVLLCAFACFTVLPAILVLFDKRRDVSAHSGPMPAQENNVPTILTFRAATGNGDLGPDATWLPRLGKRPRLVLVLAASSSGSWRSERPV